MTAPVIREQVVEHVIDGDHADEAMVFVNNGNRNQVVAGKNTRDLCGRCVYRDGLKTGVNESTQALVGWVAQHALEVHHAQEASGGDS